MIFKEKKTGYTYELVSKEEVRGIKLVFLKREGRSCVRTEEEFYNDFKQVIEGPLKDELDSLTKKASEFSVDDLVIDASVLKEIVNYFETKESIENKSLIEKIEKVLQWINI